MEVYTCDLGGRGVIVSDTCHRRLQITYHQLDKYICIIAKLGGEKCEDKRTGTG